MYAHGGVRGDIEGVTVNVVLVSKHLDLLLRLLL